MCGFIGIISLDSEVSYDLYLALNTLQHRGQDSTGILTFDGNEFYLQKGVGLVKDFFNEKNLAALKGKIGIAHVRYPTIGSDPAIDAQPFLINDLLGIGLCHNGNLVNYNDIKVHLAQNNLRLNSNSDAEAILSLFSHELQQNCKEKSCRNESIYASLKNLSEKLNGSYSFVSIIENVGLIAFRDPNAIRPMVFGQKSKNGKVVAYGFASETVALDFLGFRIIKDLAPGEVVIIGNDLKFDSKIVAKGRRKHCMFEWVYFGRPDSVIENIGVYDVRQNLGKELAKLWKETGLNADVIIPVPETSKTAALTFAKEVNLPYCEGLVKNRYVGRTFIMPNQKKRDLGVRLKLNPVIREIKNKRIILVDDSIVRGTTSRKIIDMCRAVGAKEVHFLVTCPPIKNPCFYAIDFPSKNELIAAKKTIDEIKKEIGANSLIYQELVGLKNSIGLGENICTACLTGEYPTEITDAQKKILEETRDRERIE